MGGECLASAFVQGALEKLSACCFACPAGLLAVRPGFVADAGREQLASRLLLPCRSVPQRAASPLPASSPVHHRPLLDSFPNTFIAESNPDFLVL